MEHLSRLLPTPSEIGTPSVREYDADLAERMEAQFAPRPEPTVDDLLLKAGVPPRYLPSTFESFDAKVAPAAHRVALEWAEGQEKGRGFALFGPPGTGKTHLLVSALRHRIVAGERWTRFLNVPTFLDTMRAAIRWSGDTATQEAFDFLCRTPGTVVLDDLGKEKATDWATERLYVLVEARYGRMLSTIVSSNRSTTDLDLAGYGAIVSRLQETGPVVSLEKVADYRPRLGVR